MQAFGALTHALTTTIKNNTTGRPLSNVEVVGSVCFPKGLHPASAYLMPVQQHLTMCYDALRRYTCIWHTCLSAWSGYWLVNTSSAEWVTASHEPSTMFVVSSTSVAESMCGYFDPTGVNDVRGVTSSAL